MNPILVLIAEHKPSKVGPHTKVIKELDPSEAKALAPGWIELPGPWTIPHRHRLESRVVDGRVQILRTRDPRRKKATYDAVHVRWYQT